MKHFAAALLCLLGMMIVAAPMVVDAQGPTPTLVPSPTPTNTLTYAEQRSLATIQPPPYCGTFWTPCGPLPWTIPIFPTLALPSPTIRPTQPSPTPVPASPTPTATDSTPGPTPTPEMELDDVSTLTGGINNSISTIVAQSTQVITVSGTPQNANTLADEIAQPMANTFGRVRGLLDATNSKTYSLVRFLFFALLFVVLVLLATMFVPIVMSLVRFVLSVIQAIKP